MATARTAVWCYAIWLVLTWTATAEQLVFGAVLSLAVAAALGPLDPVAAPWSWLRPRRARALGALVAVSIARIVRANLSLARRIWSPSRPVPSGMVIVPTEARTDGELAALGLITSLIVDNQLVDLDRGSALLQYHAVDAGADRTTITQPVERLVREFT